MYPLTFVPHFPYKNVFNVYLFLREREKQRESGEEQRVGGHGVRSTLQADSTEPDEGLELRNPKIMT